MTTDNVGSVAKVENYYCYFFTTATTTVTTTAFHVSTGNCNQQIQDAFSLRMLPRFDVKVTVTHAMQFEDLRSTLWLPH